VTSARGSIKSDVAFDSPSLEQGDVSESTFLPHGPPPLTAHDLGYRARFHAATLRFNDALLQAYIGSLARSDAAAHQNPTSPGRR